MDELGALRPLEGRPELAPGKRKVLVTGGGSGIGLAVATRLLAQGARVAVAGRRVEPLEALARAHPGAAFALPCDVTVETERDALLPRARQVLGGLDGLVHSAGQVVHQRPGDIDELSLRAQLEVNLVAPLRLGEAALQSLEPGGAVVFVASTLAHRPVVTSAVYSASKAGLLAATRALALAGVERQVRVSSVVPGVVDTQMTRALRLGPGEPEPIGAARAEREEAQLRGLRALHPLGRLGTGEDVAEAVVFLLGASWVTGTELVVDGGLLLRE